MSDQIIHPGIDSLTEHHVITIIIIIGSLLLKFYGKCDRIIL